MLISKCKRGMWALVAHSARLAIRQGTQLDVQLFLPLSPFFPSSLIGAARALVASGPALIIWQVSKHGIISMGFCAVQAVFLSVLDVVVRLAGLGSETATFGEGCY